MLSLRASVSPSFLENIDLSDEFLIKFNLLEVIAIDLEDSLRLWRLWDLHPRDLPGQASMLVGVPLY
jgi:hypothetical protein